MSSRMQLILAETKQFNQPHNENDEFLYIKTIAVNKMNFIQTVNLKLFNCRNL